MLKRHRRFIPHGTANPASQARCVADGKHHSECIGACPRHMPECYGLLAARHVAPVSPLTVGVR